jgi:ATP-dependent exoDNAse (exonuclease V) alpha subunit
MARRLTRDGDAVAIVVGQAGTGKTYALALLRDGEGDAGLEQYQRHGRVHAGEGSVMREQLVADWWSHRDPDGAVMLAYRRDDVAGLNRRGRERMLQSGAVAGPELLVSGRPFAAGDHVVLRRHDRRVGVANGDRAVVLAVDPDRGSMTVRVGRGDVVLPRAYLEERGRVAIQHGYALTGHTAQGLTVDRAFVLATEEASREWLYTALSRGRLENRVYGVAPGLRERDDFAPAEPERDAREILELTARRSAAHRMAIDVDRQPRGRTLER